MRTGFANYSNGFSDGLMLRNMPIETMFSGKVFWVGNPSTLQLGEKIANDTVNRGTFLEPFSTVDFAVGQCLAGRGDMILIKPGYSQSLTTADGVDVDVADVRIVGLGRGLKRAKFIYDNAAGEFVIGAANVRIENLWFVPSVTGVTLGIDVEAAADGYEIVGCRFGDAETAGTDEFLISIKVNAGADNGLIQSNYIDMGTAGAATGITVATSIGTQIRENVIMGDYSTANIAFITTAPVATHIMDNVLINGVVGGLNTEPAIEGLTGGEMIVGNNLIASDVATFALMITNFDAGYNLGNKYTDDIGGAATAVDRSASVVVSADA
jgi:hypothetical protein